jgi:hypothetical protein
VVGVVVVDFAVVVVADSVVAVGFVEVVVFAAVVQFFRQLFRIAVL